MASNILTEPVGPNTRFNQEFSLTGVGLETSWTPPFERGCVIEGFWFRFACDAAIASRFPALRVKAGGSVEAAFFPLLVALTAISGSVWLHSNRTGSAKALAVDFAGVPHAFILFESVYVPPGFTVTTDTVGLQPDDEYDFAFIHGYVL